MTLDDYINEIKNSDVLPPEQKAKAVALLTSRAITPAVLDEVQALIDSELDKSFSEAGIQADLKNPEVAEIIAKADADISSVEQDLDNSVKFFEEEMNALEAQVKEVDDAVTQGKIEDLKKDLASV
ncbi:MAG: hypothetical protein KBD26_02410 [Candidatus Pacebacteria bacterium]|nr:hypothetical protein [Candidatus Paceibacterota bacterium]MBP9772666.1 hypothetical protein [Candidatus Paceibacterota bacterium]QQR76274.1 MAG: hypothetical protein IPJ63_02055 [Candidatus Nomurabacteria bacterium]